MSFAQKQFSIHNLPYGVFQSSNVEPHIGVALGDKIIDMNILANSGIVHKSLKEPVLNSFMESGRSVWRETREALQWHLSNENTTTAKLMCEALVEQSDATMLMPCHIGDYTDFYASRYHAENVGRMFRPGHPPLTPNWSHYIISHYIMWHYIASYYIAFIFFCKER